MINEDVRHIVEAELQPGEELLWADKPAKRPITNHGLFRGGTHIFVMTIFFIFAISVLFDDGFDLLLNKLIVMIPFLLFFMASYFMRRQPFKHLFGPAHEIYGLTNKRAFIISPYWRMEKASIMPTQMQKTRVQENENVGNLIFEDMKVPVFVVAGSKKYWDAFDLWHKSELSTFHKIPNPRDVEKLIRKTFSSEEQGNPS